MLAFSTCCARSDSPRGAAQGTQDERDGREGLFDTIQRFKNHYQKRAYQCIKCLVELFSRCAAAQRVLQAGPEFRRKWYEAVDWLKEELDRVSVAQSVERPSRNQRAAGSSLATTGDFRSLRLGQRESPTLCNYSSCFFVNPRSYLAIMTGETTTQPHSVTRHVCPIEFFLSFCKVAYGRLEMQNPSSCLVIIKKQARA